MKSSTCLLGAIAGDVIGSVYEYHAPKTTQFELFTKESDLTDDSILTLGVAEAILSQRSYKDCIHEFARAYPGRGYGGAFRRWIEMDDPQPYNSFGNGSAMRVSAVGWAFDTDKAVLDEAEASASVSHNHPEGIKGAQAVALAVFLARSGAAKEIIRRETSKHFDYDLSKSLDEIRPSYHFDVTCQGTVPQAITAFLESEDFEDAIRKAISLGGDADTLAAITGSIGEPFYGGVPGKIVDEVMKRVPIELRAVIEEFRRRYGRSTNEGSTNG